jgi:mobilome CxxCx(11)CxxC protein
MYPAARKSLAALFVLREAGIMTGQNKEEKALALRAQCWDSALHAFGTGFIFEYRARACKRRLQWLTYVSLAVPLAIGLLVLGYGEFRGLKVLIGIAVAIGAVQAMLSLWSIIGGWVERYSYATSAVSANYLLSERFAKIASNPPSEYQTFRHDYEKLEVEDNLLQQQDYQQNIREDEKRMGMRAALRKFRRKCAGCDQVPNSMTPADCGVCGNFRYKVT